MLSTIPITDNFEQIDEEYKKFKHIIFNLWCEFDQYVLDTEEKKLIQLISFILQDTEGNQEENLIRALIGARVLSKYSIMNQKVCVTFFPKSDAPFPMSIQKRRFILKSIAKKCKSNASYEWDNYIIQIQNKILPMKIRNPENLESTENALIYIDFLIQYSPDFVSKFSNEILAHLLQIIRNNNYIFDLTYDILSKTNQTQDQYFSNENNYFANNAIELLRKILLNIKSIRYQSIDINDILSWEPKDKLKILAVLSVLLESCGNSFLRQYGETIRTFLNFQDDNQEIQCLFCRNLIFCLEPDEASRNDLIQNYFSIERTLDPNIICAMLQNLKLLIVNDHNTRIQQKIFDIAIKFINEDETIRNNVFDIINTFYLIYDEEEVNNLISGSQYIDQIFDTIHLEFNELAKSMAFYKPQLFFTQLSAILTKNPFETLLFLNNNKITETDDNELAEFSLFTEKNDEDNYIIEQLKDEKIKDTCQNIINSIFQLAENEDPKVRSLVPLVLIKLCPKQFLLDEHLRQFIPSLFVDPSNQVKLALLQSLNYLLNLEDETLNFNDLKNALDSQTCEEIFRPLLDATSPQETRIEAIKFFSLMAKKGSEYYFIKEHINCYKKFADPANKYALIQRRLASSSQYIPFIFNTFSSLNDNDFDKFYSFSIDFLNIATKSKTNYKNQTNLQIDTIPKSLFQLKFYETIFCSYIKGIKLLFKIKPDFIKSHIEQLINLCLTNLYYGITEKETIYILSLLEQCLYYIGLERTIEINNRNIFDTNLYQIVFNTGAHFISPLINRLIFRILGFIGGQIINEKQIFTDTIPDWKAELNYSFHKMSLDKHRRLYFYSECSDLLFNILEDESMAKSHFNALNSLITIQKRASINDEIMISEFKRSFDYFKKLLNSASIKAKDDFVPLLKMLIGFSFQAIKESIPDLVQCLIDLWEFGSSSILTTFSSILKLNLSPYLNQIIPLVISLQDSTETVKLLVSLYTNVVFNVNDKKVFFLDIINILIQMINERKYEALDGINQLIPIIIDLYEYIPSIVNTCLENVSQISESLNHDKDEEEAAIEQKCLNDTMNVLNTLLLNSKNSLATSEIFEVYRDSIIESLGPFPDKLGEFNENVEIMRDRDIRCDINFPESNREGNQENESDYLQFSFTEFVKLVTSIDKLIEDNEVNSLYIQQWLNELIMYCIQNSPSFTIRNTFQIAKNNPSFAISLFNIAFYSMLNHKAPRQPARVSPNAGTPRSPRPPPKKDTKITNNRKKSHIRITGDPRTKASAPKKVKKEENKNEIKIIDGPNRSPPNPNDNNPNGMPIQMPPRQNTEANNRNQPISNTFILLFKLEKIPYKCRSILLNLVIFMDRANAPIFNINDLSAINRPITSIFADNPPLSLLFSLRRYYKNRQSERIQAQADLERAFLNAGLVDQYHHFVRTNQITNVDDDSFILPIFANTLESIHHLKKANDFFLLGNWDRFNEQIDLSDHQIISRLFRTAFMIRDYWKSNPNNNSVPNLTNDMIFNYIDHMEDDNYSKKLEIWKEIELGFDALSHEIGTSFTQGNAPTFQSIIYGQQLVELQEMFFSNGEMNNFILRFLNTDQISSFLHHILLLRIAAKGQSKDSLHEKLELFSLCRKSSKWNLMNKYFNYFYANDTKVPVEIQYEMIYYKLATNTLDEDEISDLYYAVQDMEDQTNNFGKEYEYETLEKFIKYQKAVYYAHKFNDPRYFRKVVKLCDGFDNADAINLWSWANLKLYQLRGEKKKDYLMEAIRGYVKGSLMSDKMSVSNMISIVSLLFTYFPNNYDINLIKDDLNKLPLYLYINCAPQIISYIHKLNENDQLFNEFIYDLLIELMKKYPHGVIYEYTFSLFCDNREKDGKIIKSPIDKVRNYFLQHREILSKVNARNIFYQAYELTTNLYKVSSDIKSIIYNFSTYVNNFVGNELITAHSQIEINDFIKSLEYTNKQYAIPLYNYIIQNESNRYEPNETERADISNLLLRGLFNSLHININELIINFKQLLIWREKYYNNIKKLNHKKIKHHQKEFNAHLKKEIIKKPKKAKNCLTSSYRPRNVQIMTDSDEIEESNSNDSINLNEQNSDVIEVTPLLSLPYSDKQIPTLVIYDKSDSVENNIAVETTSSEDTITVNRNNRNNETQVSFNSNIIPQRTQRDKIAELERICKNHQRNIDTCISKISSLNVNFQYLRSTLKNHIDTSSIQVNMITESPKMEGMVDLCLPVFGTYQHNQEPILIQRFVPKCVSKKSLARPKVIHIIGNNGVDYSFMLKASEDLRADQRFMIFFRFLNRFIPTKIRTYSVTPLTVRFGVIEFVHNTMSIMEMIGINRTRVKASNNCELVYLKNNLNEQVREKPYDKLTYIQRYELLHELTENFPKRSLDLRNSMWYCAPNAETWVKYIVNFNKYCAVTSIVGYIIGIGDRHNENIMFDKSNGSVVHIDFTDCFEIDQQRIRMRERVPFRLTRNIVTALGPCGCNGTFRSSCEVTLDSIRENREIIYNILEVFSVSPIQPYGRVKDIQRSEDEINHSLKKNSSAMKRIEKKLNGTDRAIIYDRDNLNRKSNENDAPMSVQEHVDRLIAHASSEYYISSSFSGWRPYL